MIPLFKVAMSDEASKRVEETLASGYIGEGPRVKEFEKEFGERFGFTSILATNSCTSALDLAYHLIGIGEGDLVISTPMTCLATNMPLALRGAEILWADVDKDTGNIDPKHVEGLFDSYADIKAIICTDWAGRTCDYDELRRAAPGVPIVEDAAHALGAAYYDISSVHGGDYIAWSFQAIKHLTTGDGGMLRVPILKYDRARLLRWYGLDRDDSEAMRCLQQAPEPGFKYQMNDIAASIGLANMKHVRKNLTTHRLHAAYYNKYLPKGVSPPYDAGCSYWVYTILIDDPQAFEVFMQKEGVQVSQVHVRNDWQDCLPEAFPLPGLDAFQSRMVSIPCGWWLTDSDRKYIVEKVHEYVE